MRSNSNSQRTATRKGSQTFFEKTGRPYEMLKSLQVCHLEDNEKLLVNHIANTQGNIELCSHLKGLKAVWQQLMTHTISDDGQSI